jgi:hypothetical protein
LLNGDIVKSNLITLANMSELAKEIAGLPGELLE